MPFLRNRGETRAYQIRPSSALAQASFPYVSAEQASNGYSGFEVAIDSTARTGGTSITPSIEEYDEAAQAWESTAMLTGAAITTADTRVVLRVGPTITASANVAVQRAAPRRWRVRVTEQGTITSATFSIGVTFFD